MGDIPNGLASFPLMTALLERRSRRFGAGFRLNGGPLAFESQRAPAPLSTAEQAALASAANGGTGYALSELPFLAPFNTWSANVTGSTYFVTIAELTVLYINVLLSFFDEEWSFFFVDDHNGYQPAGIATFGRSRGGHLHDDPRDGRVGTVTMMESWIREFGTVEIGGMVQSLGLMAGAIGVGGFPHFVGYPGAWPAALGVRMLYIPFSRTIGAPASRRPELHVPTAIGLEQGGE